MRFFRFISIICAILSIVPLKAQDTLVFKSANLHCADTVLVFTPRQEAGERFLPTLILLHGYGGKYSDWSRNTDLQALCDGTGFRIVCPDGFYKSWYFNDANPSGMQWRSFFWEECWPALAARYGLSPDKTFIDGLSMGGHGAMNLFLDHPDRFRGAGSMSGILVLKHSGGSREIIPGILGVDSIDNPVCEAESAINRLDRIREICGEEGAKQKIIVVSCGTEDKFIPASDEFVARCRQMGLRHIALFSPGKHRWPYWTWALPRHLSFFAEELH